MKNRYFQWLRGVGAMLLAVLMFGCSKAPQENKIRIGVSIPSADHGWTGGVVWWAEQTRKKYSGADSQVEIIVSTARDAGEQVDKVENLLMRGIQALVILPHEPGPLTGICERVAGQGVYLVVVDRGLDRQVQNVTVAGDNEGFGRECARALAEKLSGQGRIVIMEGIPCPVNSARVEAFKAVLQNYPGISILDSQPAYWDPEKGLKVMENFLQKYSELDAVWTGDDDVLLGALRAYQESGRKDVKFFIGGAGSKTVVKKILDQDPLIPFNVTYPPNMIAEGVEEAVRGVQSGDTSKGRTRIIPAEIITPANAAEYYFPDSTY